jgi:hypothetical protein
MENKQTLMRKSHFVILLLGFLLLFVGTGCKIFQKHNHGTGQLISTPPHGRLAPGEIDDMSGRINESKNGSVKEKKHRRQ